MRLTSIIHKNKSVLLPVSWLYKLGATIYHTLYDSGILKSTSFTLPIICVGNLSVGGTGKTPMVEYLIRLLGAEYKIATISRGYRRNTKGFKIADETTTAEEIGDEPMQFYTNYPHVKVIVDENRVHAVQTLLNLPNQPKVIILDDAFQHRSIRAGMNILLTEHGRLFPDDAYLPYGSLRDLKRSYSRADIIVVTKCPPDIDNEERTTIIKKINPMQHVPVFFTKLEYGQPYHVFTKKKISLTQKSWKIILLTGIAGNQRLTDYVKKAGILLHIFNFKDHHSYSTKDVEKILMKYQTVQADDVIIITTEKDAVKLKKFKDRFANINIFAIPVVHDFLFGEKSLFDNAVLSFIKNQHTIKK